MKKVICLLGVICMLWALCACKGEAPKEQETSTTAPTELTQDNTSQTLSETVTENITQQEKEKLPIDITIESQLSGAVDYLSRINENEFLFILWENDNKDHLYIYNSADKTLTDTGKAFEYIPKISNGVLREVIKPAMTEQLKVRLYDSDFNPVFEKQVSSPCITINHYAVSDDSKSVVLFENSNAKFINLETDEALDIKPKDCNGYPMESIISFDDETCFAICKAKNKAVYCITDRNLDVIKAFEFDSEKAAPVSYDDFILVYEKSEIIPKKYGEASVINKKTGEMKTVKFSGQIGEGQNVTASDDGKYLITRMENPKSQNLDLPDILWRIYDVDSGKKVYEKSFGFKDYGAIYLYVDSVYGKVYVFQYDMESSRRKVTISDIG